MHFDRRLLITFLLLSLAACARGPSREEALRAIRAAQPALEQTDLIGRVWQDGPPWFSCADVIAKFTTAIDSAAVISMPRPITRRGPTLSATKPQTNCPTA